MKGISYYGFNLATIVWLAGLPVAAQSARENSPAANHAAPIPMDQLGAMAGKQYQGDGLSVTAMPDGARLRCAFQRLEGEVTSEGLWLHSTAGNPSDERFRVMAVAAGRTADFAPACVFPVDFVAADVRRLSLETASDRASSRRLLPTERSLPFTGSVTVVGSLVRFIRPGLTEEYSASVDGVRQDFVVEQRPEGDGELRVELEVAGAKAEPLLNGARLVLDGSRRMLAYNRLRVVDATGRELPARMEVASGILPDVEGGILPPGIVAATTGASGFNFEKFASSGLSAGLEAPALRQSGTPAATRLAVLVDDTSAIYPVRIDPTFSDADWISMGGLPGADSLVFAAATDALGNLYIGGWFNLVGDVVANRIAKWDGTAWSALGSGMNGNVTALAVSGTNLYAGGLFTSAGGTGATNVAKWDGSAWSALGSGMNNQVNALVVFNAELFAGGSFTTAGGSPAKAIAKWNGSTWSEVGGGMGGDYPYVFSLAASGSQLYAGGAFTFAGGFTVNRIARWNGSVWSALGTGMNDAVFAVAMSGANVYAGGAFTTAGGNFANYTAKWNGSTWLSLGSGMNDWVSALAMDGTLLYAGGWFTTAGGVTANRIARWNGSGWSTLGVGMNRSVEALVVYETGRTLYAGGNFATAGGTAAINIAKWNGITWSALGAGMNDVVMSLTVSDTNLYVAGYFTKAGGTAASRIAKWDGSAWSALGEGMNDGVNALAISGATLYAGGAFTNAGGITVNRIAKWDGSAWTALGEGMNDEVHALALSGTTLYAGGAFTNAGGTVASRIARWDGTAWTSLGAGMNDAVYALTTSGTDLYAGGTFTNAGGIEASRIAKWNGTTWSALGSGIGDQDSYVFALVVSGAELYAGGTFTTAGGIAARCVAKWNGSTWSALGLGVGAQSFDGDAVYALAQSGTDLYAGGYFKEAGGNAINYVAKWDGIVWSALGSGMDYDVRALGASGTNLYVGGEFLIAGNKVSASIARANISAARGRFSNLIYSPATGFSSTFSDGTVGQPYRIQTSPSLAVGPWTDLTNFIYAGPVVITDASAVSTTNTFYRAVTP